jgi:hypothetical protein
MRRFLEWETLPCIFKAGVPWSQTIERVTLWLSRFAGV